MRFVYSFSVLADSKRTDRGAIAGTGSDGTSVCWDVEKEWILTAKPGKQLVKQGYSSCLQSSGVKLTNQAAQHTNRFRGA